MALPLFHELCNLPKLVDSCYYREKGNSLCKALAFCSTTGKFD
jgi:hypothetical protein